jgi:mycothiol synthase
MKAVKLTADLIPAFKQYYNRYSSEQDESFPPGDDYMLREDEPAYLLLDDAGIIHGAAVLMNHKAYAEAESARFRMFHCDVQYDINYRLLLDEILKHTSGLNDIYCFVEDNRTGIRDSWERTGFTIKRYSWVLKRITSGYTQPEFPQGYELRTFRPGMDEEAWCDIINESFAEMQGHTQLYPEKIGEWRKDPSYIADGMKLLWHGNNPVGTMALIKEDENNEEVIFIEAVGILNSYQGQGLGKNMIRAGIEFAENFGTKHVMLSVNAENERAAELYLKEGFRKDALFICYSYKLRNI